MPSSTNPFAGLNSRSAGPLLAGPMLGEAGETFARVWAQARDEAPLTLTVRRPEGDLVLVASPSPEDWLCVVFHVDGLEPGHSYEYTLSSAQGATPPARLRTAPSASARKLTVAFGSCFFYYDRPQPIFDAIRADRPDVFVMAGDNCYYVQNEWDSERAMMLAQLRNRNHAGLRQLAAGTPVLGIWDDHDFGPNDSDSTFEGKDTSLPVFCRMWAQRTYGTAEVTGIFSTVRLGPVEIFLLDGRYYRLEQQRIHGDAQLDWLEERLLASDAPVKLLVSGSQVLPEAAVVLGWECWRRDAPDELERLTAFLERNDIQGVVFASGDVHLGYLLHSGGRALPGGRVGPDLWELTSSPLANDLWDHTVARSGILDRFIAHESEAGNYGIVDVDLDRRGEEIRLVLKDPAGAVLLDQPIALTDLQVRPGVAQVVPEKLCPVVWSNGKAYFFRGDRYLRYDLAEARVDEGFPRSIASAWRGIWPRAIDAAVEWTNGKAYFFQGSKYLAYDVARDRVEPGVRDIATHWRGLWPSGVDAALVRSEKAYFFKGAEYLRYDLALDCADPGYPRSIASGWPGLWPDGVDGAFVGPDGKAHFFKGEEHIQYDLAHDRADPGYPRPIAERWPGLAALGGAVDIA